MSNIIRYRTPLLQQLHRLSQEWDQLFDSGHIEDSSTVETSHWAPAVDIKEEPTCFLLFADIPGVDPKDIEISMENGILTIKGERVATHTEEKKGYTRVERSQGCFYRRFALPDTADADKITAEGKQGVLKIIIPKREKAAAKKIKVEAKKD
ncbi:heat-shock protein Hsp20 [Rickettsiella grylli]|uniref:Hsp20/alpha crystallin family protein n=1 Tax=Rickettsiella grylli TaxID=59196 RepID=UPI0008FCE639|nr:Hsp20/alpha crystallin family protein [Rickettsiella grylli]OJA00698.1 heat-shock protein Hsp20 [Rickettsiella grylli]